MNKTNKITLLTLALTGMAISSLFAQGFDTEEAPQMRGVTKNVKNGWTVDPLFTVGETDNNNTDYSLSRFGYRVPGLIDGMYAFKKATGKIDLLLNHELSASRGYTYYLQNGTALTGARVTKMRIEEKNDKRGVKSADLAYTKIYDRYYNIVTNASQINEGANPGTNYGIDRLCSANGIEKNKYGFKDNIFFTGEETSDGQEFILDVDNEILYCAPAMGRAAWENVCVLNNFNTNKVVLLIGDDRGGAPLLLYIGEKNSSSTGSAPNFLKENGLAKGNLYVWVANNGDRTPQDWNGTGTSRSGKFVRIQHFNAAKAGMPGYDLAGWANNSTQDSLANGVDNFKFSRPEDVETNPLDGTQAVLASTGLAGLFPADAWGTTYKIDLNDAALITALNGPLSNINNLPADLTILYDGDDAGSGQFPGPDFGLRSPDNLTWSNDGYIYINEDKSISGFCSTSGVEASVWQLNPSNGILTRILEMDRNAVPFKQTDSSPADCGNWESTGVIDVTNLFKTENQETLLLIAVQGHSNNNVLNPNSPIGGNTNLSEGGQILFTSRIAASTINSNSSRMSAEGSENENNILTKELQLYPNPADDLIKLSKESNIKIYDAMGNLVIEQTGATVVNVSGLKSGIYYLKANNGEVHKIIKN